MKIQLDKQYLYRVDEVSHYDDNIYKLPFKINDYEYIQEEYDEFSNEYQYILGWIYDDCFIPELFFIPDEEYIIDLDSASKSNDWC